MNKAELLQAIRTERARFEAALAQVEPGAMSQPGANGGWSVKDILAHLTTWEQRKLHLLPHYLRGETPHDPAPINGQAEVDAFNRQTFLDNQNRPLKEVHAAFHASHHEMMAAIEALTDAQLQQTAPGNVPIWETISWDTYGHYGEHIDAVLARARSGHL